MDKFKEITFLFLIQYKLQIKQKCQTKKENTATRFLNVKL